MRLALMHDGECTMGNARWGMHDAPTKHAALVWQLISKNSSGSTPSPSFTCSKKYLSRIIMPKKKARFRGLMWWAYGKLRMSLPASEILRRIFTIYIFSNMYIVIFLLVIFIVFLLKNVDYSAMNIIKTS
jgi:hypothetical protein